MIFKKFVLYLLPLSFLFQACTGSESISFYVEQPEQLKKDKFAQFYGAEAKVLCENYRKYYASVCDTVNQPFVKCIGLNRSKYEHTYCE